MPIPSDRHFLITGGTGSFGQTMVDRLLVAGAATVRVLSRDEEALMERVAQAHARQADRHTVVSRVRYENVFVRKANACTIGDLAAAACNLFGAPSKLHTLGIRHGEKTTETLARRRPVPGNYDCLDQLLSAPAVIVPPAAPAGHNATLSRRAVLGSRFGRSTTHAGASEHRAGDGRSVDGEPRRAQEAGTRVPRRTPRS